MKSCASSSAAHHGSKLEMVRPSSHNGTGPWEFDRKLRKHMPTLFRFVTTLLFLAGLVYGVMYAVVLYVEPNKGEMTVRIPPERLNPPR
jgi:hypothetical protein